MKAFGVMYVKCNTLFDCQICISVAKIQNPFSVHLVKNELWAFSESLGPLLSIPPPVMTVAGL